MSKKTGNLLIERVLSNESQSSIIPVAMNKKGALEKLEFGESKISSSISSIAFMPDDSDTNVSFLDHRNVISSIPNSCSQIQCTKKISLNLFINSVYEISTLYKIQYCEDTNLITVQISTYHHHQEHHYY